ncbi:TetR/AcrR family transcriptional regulator [Pseudaestuariivita atlantica]|uniref:HTH tetR-type domain-containing protein n=1 Tax=Pseudaestuariivita atlantica TaxID=1317121 RepID=A0A0L1JRA0_9RHOB|nr:TetR/AcrR family transcriptional regulator [Pseudaestuariivita atlantica]KNG94275.1 hypothetical protein ATO11_08695 [Pseudaestuariivita atlantica]
MTDTTREKLIENAALLFQERGFHGVGVADILKKAGVPKGSLYHHFRNGKADLAVAAAEWTSGHMMRIIDDAFGPAQDFDHGMATLCHKLAKLFDIQPAWRACPIASSLFDGPENQPFRIKSAEIFDRWSHLIASHAIRLGIPAPEAEARGRMAFIAIQGAWTLAHAQGTSDVLRQLPALMAPASAQSS